MQSFSKIETIHFIIPDVDAFQSGGNIYNKNIVDGLLKIGKVVKVMDWDTFKARKESLRGYYFFDTLYFEQLAKILSKKVSGMYYYLIVHHLESLFPPKNWTNENYFSAKEYPTLKLFDGFLTSSQFTANYLTNNKLPAKKIVILPAIDFQSTNDLTKSTINIQVVMVANLIERKGILPFLQNLATSSIIKKAKNLKIHLIGTSEIAPIYAQSCLQTIDQHPKLNSIISYHGQLSSHQVHSFYREANLFISTAFMETYGMALQEARAFRLPILALRGGNVANHVANGQTGWLFEDMASLVHQLEKLVKQPTYLTKVQEYIIKKTSNNFYNWDTAAFQFVSELERKMS